MRHGGSRAGHRDGIKCGGLSAATTHKELQLQSHLKLGHFRLDEFENMFECGVGNILCLCRVFQLVLILELTESVKQSGCARDQLNAIQYFFHALKRCVRQSDLLKAHALTAALSQLFGNEFKHAVLRRYYLQALVGLSLCGLGVTEIGDKIAVCLGDKQVAVCKGKSGNIALIDL